MVRNNISNINAKIKNKIQSKQLPGKTENFLTTPRIYILNATRQT